MQSISDRFFKKYPKLFNYKPGVDFIARLFFIGIFILLIKKIYVWNADINGNLSFPFIGSFSLIELLRHFLLGCTQQVLHFLGYQSFIHGWIVGIPGGAIILETPCLGINICFVFICLVAAYPSHLKWQYILLYILLGLVIIQLMNLGRLVAMVFVVKNQYKLPIEHHDLFNMIIYTVVILLFFYYTNLTGNKHIRPENA
jgi:exosortase/archaeosortase family protein